jgi:chromosome partitioning protein
MSLLVVNAIGAADRLLVPVVPHYLALEGLVNLTQAMERIREGIGASADLLGIVLTQVDYRSKVTEEIVGMIRGHYGEAVLDTEVRINVRLSEAPSFGLSIFEHDPSSTGAKAYETLTEEILRKARKAE